MRLPVYVLLVPGEGHLADLVNPEGDRFSFLTQEWDKDVEGWTYPGDPVVDSAVPSLYVVVGPCSLLKYRPVLQPSRCAFNPIRSDVAHELLESVDVSFSVLKAVLMWSAGRNVIT